MRARGILGRREVENRMGSFLGMGQAFAQQTGIDTLMQAAARLQGGAGSK